MIPLLANITLRDTQPFYSLDPAVVGKSDLCQINCNRLKLIYRRKQPQPFNLFASIIVIKPADFSYKHPY